jgi:hypothetical protein
MARFLHIGFTWKDSPPKIGEIESILNKIADDWLRYSAESWIVWSARPASDFFYAVKTQMGENDMVLIAGLNMTDRNGWQPKWVWEWMDLKRELGPPPPPAPPPADFGNLLTGLGAHSPFAAGYPSLESLLNPPTKK